MFSTRKSIVVLSFFLLSAAQIGAQKPQLVIPLGHAQAINSFDFSSNGAYLLTGGLDGFVKLWKTETGQELQYYCGPKGYQVAEAILTPDDKKIIIGADNGAIYIFETFSGKALHTFKKADLGKVNAVAVSPDGKHVWSAHESRVVYWNIETGAELFRGEAHQAEINDLAIAPDGKTGISVGDDQQVVFWDLNQGEVRQVMADHSSKVVWASFVQDGAMAVTAASNHSLIYRNAETGIPLNNIQIPEQGELAQVAISSDNQFLLTRTYSGETISPYHKEVHLWSITSAGLALKHTFNAGRSGRAIGIDPDQQSIFTSSEVTGQTQRWGLESGNLQTEYRSYAQGIHTTYLTEQHLVAVSHDPFGTIKIFDLNQNKNIKVLFEDLPTYIQSSAISEDGQLLVVNPAQTTDAQLFDLQNMQLLKPFRSTVGNINCLDMSGDKKFLTTSTENTAYLWDLNTGALLKKMKGHQKEITQLSISPDQRFLFTASTANAQLWDLETGQSILSDMVQLESESPFIKHAFSSNGQLLAVGDGWRVVNIWDLNNLEIKFSITSETVLGFSTFYFSGENEFLYAGESNGDIQVYKTADGSKHQSFQGYGNRVNNIAGSSGGDLILSTSEDQTLKISGLRTSFRNSSGVRNAELAQVVGLGQKDWAIVSPRGLFDASPGAMELMYFVVPSTSGYEVIELEQLKSRYRDPGLLQKLLGKVNEPIRWVDGLREVALHPEVTGKIVNDELQLQLQERSGKIGRVSVFVNEKEVERDISNTGQKNGQLTEITYDLKPHNALLWANPNRPSIVSVEVSNEEGWLSSKRLQLDYSKTRQTRGTGTDGTAWRGTEDPTLYIISVGTADYTDTILDLRYAEQDAAAMSKALYTTGNQLFDVASGVEAYCLTTKKDEEILANTTIQWSFPSKENIRKTFLQVKGKAKAEDVVVVYFSGHGLTFGQNDQVQFYYLTQAFANEELIEVADTRQKFAISSDELTEWLKEIPALKQVLIIDACNSGNVVENIMVGRRNINSSQIRAIDRMQDRTGMYILSGSAANKVSYESSEFGQGLLTYSLLNGMRQGGLRVDQDGQKLIDVMRLFNHARDEVPDLARSIQGIQTPTIGFPKSVASVDIGIFNEQVDIPVANKKPVVINTTFLNQNSMVDDLQLNFEISKAFQEESEKGKNANFIFFPVNAYPDAYKVTGLYEMIDDKIHLKAKLTQTGSNPQDLTIKPAQNPNQLVKMLMKAIKNQLE